MNGAAFDLSSPHGRMLATILLGIAELELDLSQRVKSGLAAAKARGKNAGCGGGPFLPRGILKVGTLFAVVILIVLFILGFI